MRKRTVVIQITTVIEDTPDCPPEFFTMTPEAVVREANAEVEIDKSVFVVVGDVTEGAR